MLKIHEFRYLTTDDRCNPLRQAWSRVYEYERIIEKLEQIKPIGVHNVACGLGRIHIDFANYLNENFIAVENSDNEARPESEERPSNYFKYDILQKLDKKYGAVVCISTLEHLDIDKMMLAFENLLEQVEDGGHLLLTFDYPNVPVDMFEKRLGVECKKEGELLNGSNSVCQQDCRKDLNIIVLHIQK